MVPLILIHMCITFSKELDLSEAAFRQKHLKEHKSKCNIRLRIKHEAFSKYDTQIHT